MLGFAPAAADIVNAAATATTSSLVSVPGGKVLSAVVVISGSQSGLGTATPRLVYTVPGGTSGAAPGNGSILHRLSIGSVVGVSTQDSSMTEIVVHGGDNGCTIDFNSGGAANVSVVISGILL